MPYSRKDNQNARLRALVRGRVQGVFFRDFARVHARALGLVGWVRNLSDGGSVEVIAEGTGPSLRKMLAHIRKGPPGARVVQVDFEWEAATGEFHSFQVR